jgi:DNA-binding transcriptional regulator YbjK
MPPTNTARRERLADAAIDVLATEGARGLTHRAVDAASGEPAGTTSRYFRTRDALLRAAVERVRALHFADLERAPRGHVAPEAIAEHLASMVHDALTRNRHRHLAVTELFLESTRRPELQALMTELRVAQIQLFQVIHRAAGVDLSAERAALLVTAISGVVVIALTTPEAVGLRTGADVRALVRAMVAAIHAAPALAT